MPKPIKDTNTRPSQDELANQQLTDAINKWTGSVFRAAKTIGKDGMSNLQRYVGPAYDAESIRSVPFLGGLADYMAEEKYKTRKNGGTFLGWERWGDGNKPKKVSQEEQDIIEQMKELQGSKVFQMARSTFTDAQLERIKGYTPNPTNDDNTILNYAIGYKMENELSKFVNSNSAVRKAINRIVDTQIEKYRASGSRIRFSPDEEKRILKKKLVDYIGDNEFSDYKEYLKDKLKNKDPQDLKNSDFSPAIYGLDKINRFFQTVAENPDVDLSRSKDFIGTDEINDEELPGALKSSNDRTKVAAERYQHNKNKFKEFLDTKLKGLR